MNYFFGIIFFAFIFNNYLFSQFLQKDDLLLAKEIGKPTEFIEQAFDVLHYDVSLDLTKAPSPDAIGICRIKFRWTDSPDTNKFYFHLRDLKVDSVFYEKQKIDATPVGDKSSATFHYEVIPPFGKKGDTVISTIYYQGRMTTEPSSPYWGGVGSRGSSLFAMGVGFYNNYVSATQHWMPCYDLPSDKATFTGSFLVKNDKVVASVGDLIHLSDNLSERLYVWHTNIPVATYLLTFAVDNYIEINLPGTNPYISIYTLRSDSAASARGYRLVPRMIEAFEQRFGKYPFEKVGYVNTPIGAMEHQTMISYPANLIRSTDSINMVAAHELAHQWFGDMVTCKDFRDAWLNESFATYCESIWYEYLFGLDKYFENQRAKTDRYLKSIAKQEGVFPLYDFPRTPPSSNYPETIYQKGAVILGMLRYELGDSLFFGALKFYLEKFAYSSANTEDLKTALEEYSGKELDWFFSQWVYGKGWPLYDFKIDISKNNDGNYKFTIYDLKQIQNSSYGIYDNVPLEVSFFDTKEQKYFHKVLKIRKDIDNYTIDSLPEFQGFLFNQGKNVISLLELNYAITDVAERKEEKNTIKIYPNPSSEYINISFPLSFLRMQESDIRIFNVLGECVLSTPALRATPQEGNFRIDISNLPSGIYYVRLGGRVGRFVKIE
ncbi:MAG: M1 family aminopeptidase [Candidatus Kapabacteria bacterium]|nr:M1 family aminopeptidase [Candidatus Kapabacteria bacterium]